MVFIKLLGHIDTLDRSLVGSKAFNLDRLIKMGIRVPSAFVLTTDLCTQFLETNSLGPEFDLHLDQYIKKLEFQTSKKFGGLIDPLLVSVRSGSVISMPGMMDTILNLGMNLEVVEALARNTGDPIFAYKSWMRFITMFSEIVGCISKDKIEKVIEDSHVASQSQPSFDIYRQTCESLMALYFEEKGLPFPSDPKEQLKMAIMSVFKSWNNDRAISYRKLMGISDHFGTAVVVQEMVFGNLGEDSCTGVLFTRNPNTGEDILFGEYLPNAQGEDVVDGSSKPFNIVGLQSERPKLYQELRSVAKILENEFLDMQDIEFTVENSKLYILQTRTGKRTVKSALKISYDLLQNGSIDEREVLNRINPSEVSQLLHPIIKSKLDSECVSKGIGVSFGAVTGRLAMSVNSAIEMSKAGPVILVAKETTAEDIEGIYAADGVLTQFGGITSHAAVVARSLGKTCVCSANFILDYDSKSIEMSNGLHLSEGSMVTIDGETGEVLLGQVELELPGKTEEMQSLLQLIQKYQTGNVRVNADSVEDLKNALSFGASGVGLCRSEHMMLKPEILKLFQKYILSEKDEYLLQLIELLTCEVESMLCLLHEKTFLIRLLDPPLHEFLPSDPVVIARLQSELNFTDSQLKARLDLLSEHNPMLGFRGCRLGILKPIIYKLMMQAILQAASNVNLHGVVPKVQIQVPFVCDPKELKLLKGLYDDLDFSSIKSKIEFGAMLETPRSCLLADEIA